MTARGRDIARPLGYGEEGGRATRVASGPAMRAARITGCRLPRVVSAAPVLNVGSFEGQGDLATPWSPFPNPMGAGPGPRHPKIYRSGMCDIILLVA